VTEEVDDTSIESPRGGPRRLLVAGAAAAAVFAALVVATRGDGGGAGCMSGLADHLPSDLEVVDGGDLDRAEDAGIDVGSINRIVDAYREVGFQPDPLTNVILNLRGERDPEATAGYAADDVDCWVGHQTGAFVAEGDFDADRVARAEESDDLAVDGDLLAYDRAGDPEAWFERSDDDTPARAAVRKFDDLGALMFSGFRTGDDDDLRWVGLGLGRTGDGWELLGVWAFADVDLAESSVGSIVDAIEEGEVPSMIEGDVADRIERDGALLTLRAPMRVEPSEWRTPFIQFDPMLGALRDFGDDDSGGEEDAGDGG
jgi:hypothetical protein